MNRKQCKAKAKAAHYHANISSQREGESGINAIYSGAPIFYDLWAAHNQSHIADNIELKQESMAASSEYREMIARRQYLNYGNRQDLMNAQNNAHVTFSSMDVQRQIDTLNIMSAALPTDEEIKGYFNDWEKQETMLTENPTFKILFWSVLIIALIVSAVLAVV